MDPFMAYLWLTVGSGSLVGLMALFGIGEEFDLSGDVDITDGDLDAGEDSALSPFSPIMLSVFLTSFGVAGMMLEYATELDALLNALIAALSSLPVYLGLFVALRAYFGSSFGYVRGANIVGRDATVKLPIGPNKTGSVSVSVRGESRRYPARSDNVLHVGDVARITAVRAEYVEVEPSG